MKKYIEIEMGVLERLVDGKCVEGSLRRNEWTGKICFRAYNRQSRNHPKDRLVKKLPWGWVKVRKLPWGWVKESMQRIKVFGSFPKDVGTAQVMGLLQDHTRDAKNALIERELIEFC